MVTKQKTFSIILEIVLHAFGWINLFMINYFFINNYQIRFDFLFHIKIWIIYIIVFYANYYFLLPKLLFRKKIITYILITLLILACASLLKNYYESVFFEKMEFMRMGYPNPMRHLMMHLQPINPFNKPWAFMPEGILFSFYGLLLIYSISTIIRFVQKWIDDERHSTERDKQTISAELSYLKQQVNPHFLFNALNNIYSLTIDHSAPASDALLKLSSILRYMLYETEKKQVMLKEELDVIKNYLELQKLRVTSKVTINFNIEGDPETHRIAPLLIIPLIENAFKYGADNMSESFIDIQIRITGNTIDLNIRNKIMLKEDKNAENSGIGIKNLARRLDLIYPGSHIFEVNKSDDVFIVHLQITLK